MALTSSALSTRWFGRQFLQTSNVGAFLAHESSTQASGTCLFNISTHTCITKVFEYNPHPPTRACLTPCVSHHIFTAIRCRSTRPGAEEHDNHFDAEHFCALMQDYIGLSKDLNCLDWTRHRLNCVEVHFCMKVEKTQLSLWDTVQK